MSGMGHKQTRDILNDAPSAALARLPVQPVGASKGRRAASRTRRAVGFNQ